MLNRLPSDKEVLKPYKTKTLRERRVQKRMKMNVTPRLETDRLLLTRPQHEEDKELGGLWRDEQVRQYLGGAVSEDIVEKKLQWLQMHWEQAGFGQWMVYEKATEQIAGLCGLHHSTEGIELSYMFYPAFWGKGIGTEAAQACIVQGFEQLRLERILVITQEANTASCRLAEKLGMRKIERRWEWEAWQSIYEIT